MMNSSLFQFWIISAIVSHNCILNRKRCITTTDTIHASSTVVCTRSTIYAIWNIGKIGDVLALWIISIWFGWLHQIWIRYDLIVLTILMIVWRWWCYSYLSFLCCDIRIRQKSMNTNNAVCSQLFSNCCIITIGLYDCKPIKICRGMKNESSTQLFVFIVDGKKN